MAGGIGTFGDAERRTVVCEDPDKLAEPVLAFFLSYWRAKLNGRLVPLASDFAPREVRAKLRWVVLMEALPEYIDFRYRVVGSSVCEYFLGDGTGKTVREAFAHLPDLAEGIVALHRRVCALAKPVQVTSPHTVVDDVFFPNYDSLYLPYSKDGSAVDRVVTCFVFNPGAFQGRRPYKFTGWSARQP